MHAYPTITLSTLIERMKSAPAEVVEPKSQPEAEKTDTPDSDGDSGMLEHVLLCKTTRLYPTVEVLELQSTNEIARLLTLLVARAQFDNGKDRLAGLATQLLDQTWLESVPVKQRQKEAFNALRNATGTLREQVNALFAQEEHRLALQSLMKKGGEFEIAKDGPPAPPARPDAVKMANHLSSHSKMAEIAAQLDWSGSAFLKDLSAVLDCVTHPVKLSNPQGTGGRFIEKPAAHANSGSVSEADYLTLERVAVGGGSAQLAPFNMLALANIQWNGRLTKLVSLLSQDADLRAAVADELAKMGASQTDGFLTAICQTPNPECWGASEVFVVTGLGDSRKVFALEVLTPLALPMELNRARAALQDEFEAERPTLIAALESDVQAQKDALSAVKAGKPGKKGSEAEKALHNAQVAEAQRQLDLSKDRLKSYPKFLSVPSARLLIGGSTPRNVVPGLTTSIHRAALSSYVRTSYREPLANKVFVPHALLMTPFVPRQVPFSVFEKDGAPAKAARREVFADLAKQAMADLMALRDAWAVQAPVLTVDAIRLISGSHEGWALFVRGAESLNLLQKQERFGRLRNDIFSHVKKALVRRFKDFPNHFDEELRDVVAVAVRLECA